MNNRYLTLLILFLSAVSCEPEISEFKPGSGNADFSVFVTIGDSQTAGFANNELYKSGQIVSFANIISRQLLHVGGGEFKQPLMRDELGFGNKLSLGFVADCYGDSLLLPVPSGGIPDETNTSNIFAEEGPFHNLGVPGAKILHLQAPVNSTGNPFYSYFARFASAPSTSVLLDAMSLNATFFSLWIGTSDILDYAMTGGTGNPVIDTHEFSTLYHSVLMTLTSGNAAGIVANIPNVLNAPFFFHIPPSGIWVEDTLSPSGKRMLEENEIVLLRAEERIKCDGWGTEAIPLPESFYLSKSQVMLIKERTAQFNTVIKQTASEFNLSFLDMYSLFENTTDGITFDGITFTNTFISGGLYSLDGISLTRRGNAIVANAFIEAINKKYDSTIPMISITQFQGIEYP
ncbi:MAG: hypothetical protein EA361_01025, partial [Bacteroidetes bacterium]